MHVKRSAYIFAYRYERWDTPEFYRPSEQRQQLDRELKAKNELAEKQREEWRLAYEKDKEDFYRKLNGKPKCRIENS